MIELDRHIEILLLNNDCVIVPELGGFMAHHIDARYDEGDHTFLPPLRTLGFNPQLTMNDSLLAQSYVEAYDLSYPEALRRIEDEVNELKQHLETEGSYELSDIGTLSLNEDGKYVFAPCEAGILTPELYGLSSFEMTTLAETARQLPVLTVAEDDTEDAAAEPAETAPETVETETETEDEERAIVIKMSWIRNAVAVAAAVLAFFVMTTPVSNSKSDTVSMGNLSTPILTNIMPKDTSVKKVEKVDISKEIEKAKPAVEEAAAPEAAARDGYCIVLASYVTKKNANDFVERLHKRGYKEAEVYIRNNVTRVVFGNFKTANEAYTKLNSIHDDKDFEEAWVLKVKDRS